MLLSVVVAAPKAQAGRGRERDRKIGWVWVVDEPLVVVEPVVVIVKQQCDGGREVM